VNQKDPQHKDDTAVRRKVGRGGRYKSSEAIVHYSEKEQQEIYRQYESTRIAEKGTVPFKRKEED
jgi:hypothetical protein